MKKILFAFLSLFASSAFAVFNESTQCPGKASPLAGVLACYNWDVLTNCTTGLESQCFLDNAPNSLPDARSTLGWGLPKNWHLSKATDGAVGAGYTEVVGGFLGAGGYTVVPYPAFSSDSVGFRTYIRYKDGAAFYAGQTHFINFVRSNPPIAACPGSISLDYDGKQWDFRVTGCAPDQVVPAVDPVKQGTWRLLEIYAQKETTGCLTATTFRNVDCNGLMDFYIDGVLVASWTDVNWCRGKPTCHFTSFYYPRLYYHNEVPPWGFTLGLDGTVMTDNMTPLGRSTNEKPLGTQTNVAGINYLSTFQPYIINAGTNQVRNNGDCSFVGMSAGWPTANADGMSLDTTMNDDSYVIPPCGSDVTSINGSLRLSKTGPGFFQRESTAENIPAGVLQSIGYDVVVGGNVRITSGSNLSKNPILMGMSTVTTTTNARYMGLCALSTNRWGLCIYKASGAPGTETKQVVWTGSKIVFDRFHRMEVQIKHNNRVTMWINGVRVINDYPISSYPIFGGEQVGNYPFFGFSAVDLPTGSDFFTANFDSMYGGNLSRWDCGTNWGTECPALEAAGRLGKGYTLGGIKTPTIPVRVP